MSFLPTGAKKMSDSPPAKTLLCISALMLSACGPDPSIQMTRTDVRGGNVVPNDRIEIERIGVFEDGLAYDNRRGVYLIRDKQTGREYFGVSGIGIQELASHEQCTSSGKTTTCYQVEHEQ